MVNHPGMERQFCVRFGVCGGSHPGACSNPLFTNIDLLCRMPRSKKRRPKTGAPPSGYALQPVLQAFERREFSVVLDQCREILARAPGNVDALNISGGAYLELGKLDDAIDVLARAIAIRPGDATIEANLGAALATAKRFDEAEEHLATALALAPGDVDVTANLARAQFELARYDAAMATFAAALALAPGNVSILIDAIRAAAVGRDLAAAGHYARAAVAIEVQDPVTRRELTRVLYEYHQYPEGLVAAEAALSKDDADAGLHIDKGAVLSRLQRHDAALACFKEALRRDPDNADALSWAALLNLTLGRFSDGWPGYRARPSMRSRQAPDSLAACGDGFHRAPLPADLSGKTVLVEREQGLGDELFFLRFASRLRDRGARVVYRPDERLAAMLQRADIVDEIAYDGAPTGAFDCRVTLCDLPWLTQAGDNDSFASSVVIPPLPGKTAEIAAMLSAFGEGPYTGVTWRGGTPGNNRILYKEIPPETLGRSLAGADGSIVILQRNPTEDEIQAFSGASGRPVLDLSHLNVDIEAMLSLCSLLDSYVSVSNTNIHLREATGRSSHVIVPYPPEFRWMATGRESPWFPGTTLYRQAPDTGWQGAVDQLTEMFTTCPPRLREAG